MASSVPPSASSSSCSAAAAAAAATPPPPFVHAIGGCVGSALSLLLLYPLERARIELQSVAAGAVIVTDDDEEEQEKLQHDSYHHHHRHFAKSSPESIMQIDHSAREADNEPPSLISTDHPVENTANTSSRRKSRSPFRSHPPETAVPASLRPRERSRSHDSSWTTAGVSHSTTLQQQSEERPDRHSPSSSNNDDPSLYQHSPPPSDLELSGMSGQLGGAYDTVDEHGNDNMIHKYHPSEPSQPTVPSVAATVATIPSPSPPKQSISLSQCLYRLWRRNELYRGVAPIVATLAISNFVFFFLHAWTKQFLATTTSIPRGSSGSTPSSNKVLSSLLSSCLAGIGNVILTNPLWVANIRIVTGQARQLFTESSSPGASSSSLWRVMLRIAQLEGIQSLWKGTGTSILLVSNPVIQFFVYEQLKAYIIAARILLFRNHDHAAHGMDDPTSLAPLEAFVTGALAKAIATILTYPLQLAQAVMRLQKQPHKQQQQQEQQESDHPNAEHNTSDPNDDEEENDLYTFKNTWDCLCKLYRRDGPTGLFTGLRAKLLQTVLTAAFTFLTYEQILHAVHTAHVKLLVKRKILPVDCA